MVLMAMTEDYWRGHENGKQESAARIAELDTALARKDVALAAAEKVVMPMARTVDYIMKYPDAEVFGFDALNLAMNSIFAEAVETRALIAAARKAEGAKE